MNNKSKRIDYKVNISNFSITALYQVSDDKIDTPEKLEQLCNKVTNNKEQDLLRILEFSIYKNLRVKLDNIDLYYSSKIDINFDMMQYTLTVYFIPESIQRIKEMYQNKLDKQKLEADNNNRAMDAAQDDAERLLNIYNKGIKDIRDIMWAFLTYEITKNNLSANICKDGLENVENYIRGLVENYKIDQEGIYYIFNNAAVTFVSGRVKKYSISQFIQEFGKSLYVDLYNTSNFNPVLNSNIFRKSVKSLSDLYVKVDTNGRESYKRIKYSQNSVAAYTISKDAHGEAIFNGCGSMLRLANCYHTAFKPGLTWLEVIEEIKIQHSASSNSASKAKAAEAKLAKKLNDLGIYKCIYGKTEEFVYNTLSKIPVDELREIINIVNSGPQVAFVNSSVSSEINLDCNFDTARVYFGVGKVNEPKQKTFSNIKSLLKHFNTLAYTAFTNTSRFKKQGLPISFYTTSCILRKDGLLEYTFVLKNQVYELVNKHL